MKILRTTTILFLAVTSTFCTNMEGSNIAQKHSHGKSAKPNYSIVFPDNKVNRIDIKIDAEKWDEMQADLKSNIGGSLHKMPTRLEKHSDENYQDSASIYSINSHERKAHFGPPSEKQRSDTKMEYENIRPPKENRRMGPPPGGKQGGKEYEPIWAYCDVLINNKKWPKVGIHFKGNSSLRSTYQQGIKKLSFKLDFDQFEDEFPETKNQRFYGFKQLNLKNNYDDKSFIREKVAADLFADFGLVGPKTSFYRVFVDFGEGPQYFGLYTMVEEVDDTVIETGFLSEDGNLYKPEGLSATFANGSFRTTDMNKKSNNKTNNYSDVENLFTVLNSSLRIENYEVWKAQLSEIFDVPVFLKWLAVNTVMQNWDTYGNTLHNYYLYNNPSTNKLVWIPWDNNEAFQNGKMQGALSLSFDEIGEDWPFIRYIIDDADWMNEYKLNVLEFSNHTFTSERMNEIYSNHQKLLINYVVGAQGENKNYTFLENESEFAQAIDYLKQHVVERKTAVQEFLGKNKL